MANAVLYVSHTGDNTTGATWAHAITTLAAAITASGTTGTDFYVDSTQNESAAGLTFTFKGVAATPDRVFSVTTAGSTPPVTADLTAGASFSSTTTTTVAIRGCVYIYGCTFNPGTSSSATSFLLGNSNADQDIILDTCKITQGGTGAMGILMGAANGGNSYRFNWTNTTVKFGATTSNIQVTEGFFRWTNTASAIDGAGSLPTTLFKGEATNVTSVVLCDGVDLSALTNKAITGAMGAAGAYQFVNCKLPSGYTIGTPVSPTSITDLVVTDSANTNYYQSRVSYQGTLTPDTTVFNNATDGVTPLSWKVVSSANANPQAPFECFEIVQWAAAGTFAASTIQITSATASLTQSDVWVSTSYLAASSSLASRVSTGTTNQLPQGSSPSSLGAGTWGTGAAAHNYVLAVPSFTTSQAGYVRFKVRVGKPSLTVWIDPAVTIA